jgi:hypothetical protein
MTWDELESFLKKAQEETPDAAEEGEELDTEETLQDLGISDTEVDSNQAGSSFFFTPKKPDEGQNNQPTETTDYKVDDKEEELVKAVHGYTLLLAAHRVDWIIKSAYQSLFLFLRDAVKDSKTKDLTYQIRFTNTPWTEDEVSFDTLSRFNVYAEDFSAAISKIEPKVKTVTWSPTFEGSDLVLTFQVNTK